AHGEHRLPLGWGHSVSPDREKAGDLRVSQQTQDSDSAEFGPNQWLVDALREQWREDPSSVDPSWAEYFSTQGPATADGSPAETSPAPASTTTSTGAPARSSDGSSQAAASATAAPGGPTPPAPARSAPAESTPDSSPSSPAAPPRAAAARSGARRAGREHIGLLPLLPGRPHTGRPALEGLLRRERRHLQDLHGFRRLHTARRLHDLGPPGEGPHHHRADPCGG